MSMSQASRVITTNNGDNTQNNSHRLEQVFKSKHQTSKAPPHVLDSELALRTGLESSALSPLATELFCESCFVPGLFRSGSSFREALALPVLLERNKDGVFFLPASLVFVVFLVSVSAAGVSSMAEVFASRTGELQRKEQS